MRWGDVFESVTEEISVYEGKQNFYSSLGTAKIEEDLKCLSLNVPGRKLMKSLWQDRKYFNI